MTPAGHIASTHGEVGHAPSSTGLEVVRITMQFGALRALDLVSLEAPAGEITALLGENGSGKSTLVKVLAGINAPLAGGVRLFGTQLRLPLTPDGSRKAGIRILHQDLGLIETASVAENIALGVGFGAAQFGRISKSRLHDVATHALERVGVDIATDTLVADLSLRDRTFVAFARMLASSDESAVEAGRRLLILDEPTAALGHEDAREVHKAMRRAAEAGAAVILITHHLDEVLEVATRFCVLRRGKAVGEGALTGMSGSDLVALMLGDAPPSEGKPAGAVPGEPVVELDGLAGDRLAPLVLTLRAGEVLGISGERASGPGDLAGILCGILPPRAGRIRIGGKSVRANDLTAYGVAVVPEDRRGRGVHTAFSIADNIGLSGFRRRRSPILSGHSSRKLVRKGADWVARLDIRPADAGANVGRLSGGNQQKVALARALELAPKVIVLDEPTQGIDVGAQAVIRVEIQDFVAKGGAVLLLSTNYDELLALADRVVVFHRGEVARELRGEALTRAALVAGDMGGTPADAAMPALQQSLMGGIA